MRTLSALPIAPSQASFFVVVFPATRCRSRRPSLLRSIILEQATSSAACSTSRPWHSGAPSRRWCQTHSTGSCRPHHRARRRPPSTRERRAAAAAATLPHHVPQDGALCRRRRGSVVAVTGHLTAGEFLVPAQREMVAV